MNLNEVLKTALEGDYINGEIEGTLSDVKSISGVNFIFHKAKLTDGASYAWVKCSTDVFAGHEGTRCTFYTEGRGKGSYVRRNDDYRSIPNISFGDRVKVKASKR